MDFLFFPGFLKRNELWQNYPRYLRSLQIRVERLNSNYAKDVMKQKNIDNFINEFNENIVKIDEITEVSDLYNYWLLLEEARIITFTPEIPTKAKNILTELENISNNLNIQSTKG